MRFGIILGATQIAPAHAAGACVDLATGRALGRFSWRSLGLSAAAALAANSFIYMMRPAAPQRLMPQLQGRLNPDHRNYNFFTASMSDSFHSLMSNKE